MTQQFHPSSLTDYTARTWQDDEDATAAKFNGEFGSTGSTGLQTKIQNLNDAIQDMNTCHAAATAPASAQGQLWFQTDTNQLLLDPDAAGADQPINRVIFTSVTAVGATGAAATMIACTVPASTLLADGQALRIHAWGTRTGASSAAVIQFRAAAAAMGSFTLPTLSDAWSVTVLYVRTSATTEDVIMEANAADSSGWDGGSAATAGHAEVEFAVASNAVTGTIAIDIRASTVGALDVVTQEGMIVELIG